MAESCLSAGKNFSAFFSEILVVLSLLILILLILLVAILILLVLLILLILLVAVSVLLVLLIPVLLVLILIVHDFSYRMFGCLSKIFVKCRFAVGNAPKTRRLSILHKRCAAIHRKYQRIL